MLKIHSMLFNKESDLCFFLLITWHFSHEASLFLPICYPSGSIIVNRSLISVSNFSLFPLSLVLFQPKQIQFQRASA